jgi:TRAP-type mannitol/chloroaromatic compound transport system permease small subunit
MLNLLSWLIGLVCLILGIPMLIPVVGLLLWLLLPVCAVGILIGALSSKDSGRNFCIIVFLLIILRLSVFGGLA